MLIFILNPGFDTIFQVKYLVIRHLVLETVAWDFIYVRTLYCQSEPTYTISELTDLINDLEVISITVDVWRRKEIARSQLKVGKSPRMEKD